MAHIHLTEARSVTTGDVVDLEGDAYVDPADDVNTFRYEYVEVVAVEHETPSCVRIDFDNHSIGFPPDHRLKVVDGEAG